MPKDYTLQSLQNGIDDLICKAEIETDVENERKDTKLRGG